MRGTGWAVAVLAVQPWYLWISLLGNAAGLLLFFRNPLAIVAALAGSPFNTDVVGLPNTICSDKIQPGKMLKSAVTKFNLVRCSAWWACPVAAAH
jgi:hypothetical protein